MYGCRPCASSRAPASATHRRRCLRHQHGTPNPPGGGRDRFREALDEAGVPNELVVYEGAPHSFSDRTFDRYRESSDEAWKRVLAFVARLSASN
jgi:dienelactone hydrolase